MTSRRVFITGASSGFGLGTTRALAERGHHVVATMRGVDGKNADVAGSLRADAEEHDWSVEVLELDVTHDDQVEAAVEAALDAFDGIDVLINNAGVGSFGIQEAYPVEQVQALFDVNVFGVLRVNRAVLPHMRAQGHGHVIYLSSGLGRFILPFIGPYCATKFAVEALAEAGHYELRGEGIDTTIVEPGGYGTSFGQNMMGPADEERMAGYEEGLAAFQKMVEVFQTRGESDFGDPQEIVDALVELVESEPGDRPLRVTRGAEGVPAINEATAEVQKEVLAWMEFE